MLAVDPNRGRLAKLIADLGITGATEVRAVRDGHFETMPECSDLFGGLHDTLKGLRERFRLGIITNGPSDLQRRRVDYFDLEHRVDWVVVSGEPGVDKPDPAIFEHTLRLARTDAPHAAHVGDSALSDVAGANRAGLMSVWVETRFPPDVMDGRDFTPHKTITHVRELLLASAGERGADRT